MTQISWKTLFNEASQYKKRLIYGQLIAILAVVVALPVPLLFPTLIDEVILEKGGWLTDLIDSFYTVSEGYHYIVVVFIITIVLRIIFFLLNVSQVKLFTEVSKSIIFKIRERLLKHLERVSVSEYEALGGGGVSAKLVTDINTVDTFISVSIGKFIVSVLSIIGIAVILISINWQIALILLIINPTVVTVTTLLGKKIRELKKKENLKIENFQDALSETLDLFVQIRTYNQESRYMQGMISNAKAIQIASSNFGWKSEGASHVSSLLFVFGIEGIRAISLAMVAFNQLSIGEMFAVMSYLWFTIEPLHEILGIIYSHQNANASVERLNKLLTLEQEPQYPHNQNPFRDSHTNKITLKNLSFSYGENRVLHNINIEIPKGKTVALLGSSGSGKTTLAQIILGLYNAKSGDVFIDDVNVNEIGLDVIRDHISLVLQTPRMFNDSLRHNLTLGRDIDDEKLMNALYIAQLESVMEKLTDGLDTLIGKDGVRLSGGERQRLAIARMLVSNPNVVILDESTSALDVHTENNLFGCLRDVLKGKTIIIIAHRLSTIEHADLVHVIKDGKVEESGSPKELINQDGFYKNFVQSQKS